MNNHGSIILEVSLTPKDLVLPFNRFARSTYRWFLIFLAVFLVVELIDFPGFRLHPLAQPWSFSILVAVAVVAGIYFPRLRIRRTFEENPALSRSRRIEITPEGLRVESENAKGEYRWPLFCEIQETPKTFLLKQTTASAIYIPKRCFQSDEDIVRFRALLRSQYQGKLKLRPR